MAILELRNIVKRYGAVAVVDGVSLDVNEGEFVVFLGPSGCGKTTILRLIAGFLNLDEGSISVMGKEVSSKVHTVPPDLRNLSMVFQSYAIWPHMTVFDNVAYGLKLRKSPKNEMKERVMETLRMVQMDMYYKRFSHELSGGQQQRVALARALVVNPAILLLDEPLSNLDAKLRLEMRIEIKELQMRLKCTSIYVTHDQAEAMVLGDRIILLDSGKVRQQGKPTELYQLPNSCFSAFFFGATNLIRGKVTSVEAESQRLLLTSPIGDIRVARTSNPISDFKIGDDVNVSVRSGSMNIFKDAPAGPLNLFHGKVEKAIYLGDYFDYDVKVGDIVLRCQGGPDHKYEVDQKVCIGFAESASGICCFKEESACVPPAAL